MHCEKASMLSMFHVSFLPFTRESSSILFRYFTQISAFSSANRFMQRLCDFQKRKLSMNRFPICFATWNRFPLVDHLLIHFLEAQIWAMRIFVRYFYNFPNKTCNFRIWSFLCRISHLWRMIMAIAERQNVRFASETAWKGRPNTARHGKTQLEIHASGIYSLSSANFYSGIIICIWMASLTLSLSQQVYLYFSKSKSRKSKMIDGLVDIFLIFSHMHLFLISYVKQVNDEWKIEIGYWKRKKWKDKGFEGRRERKWGREGGRTQRMVEATNSQHNLQQSLTFS